MTGPTATDPFITASEITITGDDGADAASGFVRDLCNWHIWPQVTATWTRQPVDGCTVLLPTLKLTSVTSVTCGDETLDVDTDIAHDDELVIGVLRRIDGKCWPLSALVTVVGVHGYDTVPASVKAVCQSIAKRWPQSASQWTSRKMGSASVSMGTGAGAITPGSLTVVEQMVIDRYTVKPQP